MSKFRRAGTTDNLGDTVRTAFFQPETTLTDDPFAAMRARAQQNQERVQRDTAGFERDYADIPEPKSWERVASADKYETRSMREVADDLSNVTPFDTSVHSIRRASYATDDQLNRTRSLDEVLNTTEFADLRTMGAEDAKKLMGRTASIWGTDFADIEGILHDSMLQADARFRRASDIEKRREERHAGWEQEQMDHISPSLADARTPDIVRYNAAVTRTGEMSHSHNTPFGLANYAQVAAQEEERLRRQEERRASKLAIKRNGKSPAERQREWETNHVEERAASTNDVDYNWITAHLSRMSED